jgi:hypothetical protein
MPQRRANDAQVERLLHALKSDLSYRQAVARRIAEKDNIKYASAMRRLQRYVTEAGEKRAFVNAPVYYKRELRQETRKLPPPTLPPAPPVRAPSEPRYPIARRPLFEDEEDEEDEGEFDTYEVHLNDLRSIISYHDGDTEETAKALGLGTRGERLLEYQVNADAADAGANVLEMSGGGRLQDAIREFYNESDADTVQEIRDFQDIFFNLPDWEIGLILEDLRKGNTTFADWFDPYVDAGMDIDSYFDSPEFWTVWRAAYARSKA